MPCRTSPSTPPLCQGVCTAYAPYGAVQRQLEAGAIIEVALADADAPRGKGAGGRRVHVPRQRPDREPPRAEVPQDSSPLLAGCPGHENGTVSVVSDLR